MGIEGLRRVEKQIGGEEAASSVQNQPQQRNIWRIRQHREEVRGGEDKRKASYPPSAAGRQQTAAHTHTHQTD